MKLGILNHLQIIGMGTLHTITHRMYQSYYALRTNSNLLLIIVTEHYIQACILYTTLNRQTMMNCCRAHKSRHPLEISKNLHGSGTSVYQSIRMVNNLLHGMKVVWSAGAPDVHCTEKQNVHRYQSPLQSLTCSGTECK